MKYAILLILAVSPAFAANGRYMITQGEDFLSKVMLDTQTGRMWKYRCVASKADDSCAMHVWSEETVEGINTTKKDLYDYIEKIEAREKGPK